MRRPGSSRATILTVTVLGLSAVLLQSCMAQQQPDEFSERNTYYGEPMYQASVRHPRSILQNFAVDRMLKDNGFVRNIINCVLDKGPCESNGRKLRLMAPEILRGQCPGCSRTVHNQIRRVISHVQRNFPVEWSEVTRRFMSYNNPGGPGPQDYAPPRPQEFSPPRQQQEFSPPRQQEFSPPRQQEFSPPRQQEFAPTRQQEYAPARQQEYAPSRSQEYAPPQPQQPQQVGPAYNPNTDPNLYQQYG